MAHVWKYKLIKVYVNGCFSHTDYGIIPVWKICLNCTIDRIIFRLGFSCASELSTLFISVNNSQGSSLKFFNNLLSS